MNDAPDLRTLQRWFAAVMEHPRTADVALASRAAQQFVPRRDVQQGRIVRRNPRMSAADMLQVYNGGYLARLVEVLESDFGALSAMLGGHDFQRLVARYLVEHPSRHPNLNRLGRQMPAFVRKQRWLEHRSFLADLAELELACAIAFDAPEFVPLGENAMAEVAPDSWDRARFTANPSLQLLTLRHPVGAAYQAWKQDEPLVVAAPQRSWMAVFRKDDRVWRQQLTRGAHAVLSALVAGEPLGEALSRAAGDDPVTQWFQGFSADGLFVAVRVDDA